MDGLVMKYFVLKPKGDDEYAKASRKAMMMYAASIRKENLKLSTELIEWTISETPDHEMEGNKK